MLVILLIVALGAAGVGCGVLRRKAKPQSDRVVEDMRKGRRPMGQVVVVKSEAGFVLVRSPLAGVTLPDRTLVAKSPGTAEVTGKLRVTPERKQNRIAADITEGAPKVGDVVFFQTEEKVVSMEVPSGEGTLIGEAATAVVGGGDPAALGPAAVSDGGATPLPGAGHELPPLGEPSGPREAIPHFPGIEPGPNGEAAEVPELDDPPL